MLWTEYKTGFGDVTTNFWIGNDQLNSLTQEGGYRLYCELKSLADNLWYYAWYDTFTVGNESTGYQLQVTGYSGTAGNAFNWVGMELNGMKFTTNDVDNDLYDGNCAGGYGGGFWYNDCSATRPNSFGDWFDWYPLPPGPDLLTSRLLICPR